MEANWDRLATELQALRQAVGDPSFAEITRRISERRVAQGVPEHGARVARTTVYDAFRTGRSRVNLAFVREIALALGGDDAQVDEWIAGCRGTSPEVVEVPPPAFRQVLLLMAACLGINLAGRAFVEFLDLPIYLDMVGTAIAAVALGPWRGAAVGVATNLAGGEGEGLTYLPFALVNVAGALVWGYGVRRFGFGRTLPRFFVLNLIVAVVCSLIAVPLLVLVFGGTTGHGQDAITDNFSALTDTLFVAVGFSNMVISVADKVLSGFVALVAVSALPASMRTGLPLVAGSPEEVRASRGSHGQRERGR